MKILVQVYVAVIILVFSIGVFAETRKLTTDKEIRYAVLHSEGAMHFIDVYRKFPQKLQDRVDHQEFKSIEQAQVAFAKLTSDWSPSDEQASTRSTSEVRGASLWMIDNDWSWDWELRYKEFIETQVDSQFMVRYHLATDCADVALILRWIFARINHLPVGNTLAGSNELFTHESFREEWLRIPTADDWFEDARFRAVLDYLLENTYTHTVFNDSYPVSISKESLIPGGYFIYLYKGTGHTLFLHRVFQDMADHYFPIQVLYSDVPRAERVLYETDFNYNSYPVRREAGFLRARWLEFHDGVWSLREREKMPFFSLEQYSQEIQNIEKDFWHLVLKRFWPQWTQDDSKEFDQRIAVLRAKFQQRIPIVLDGFNFCSKHPCPIGSPEYEDWSTPLRDASIEYRLHSLTTFLNTTANGNLRQRFELIRLTSWVEFGDVHLTFNQLSEIWRKRIYSVDPNDSIRKRWGLP